MVRCNVITCCIETVKQQYKAEAIATTVSQNTSMVIMIANIFVPVLPTFWNYNHLLLIQKLLRCVLYCRKMREKHNRKSSNRICVENYKNEIFVLIYTITFHVIMFHNHSIAISLENFIYFINLSIYTNSIFCVGVLVCSYIIIFT